MGVKKPKGARFQQWLPEITETGPGNSAKTGNKLQLKCKTSEINSQVTQGEMM